jgi:hypothetical protein
VVRAQAALLLGQNLLVGAKDSCIMAHGLMAAHSTTRAFFDHSSTLYLNFTGHFSTWLFFLHSKLSLFIWTWGASLHALQLPFLPSAALRSTPHPLAAIESMDTSEAAAAGGKPAKTAFAGLGSAGSGDTHQSGKRGDSTRAQKLRKSVKLSKVGTA